MNPKKAVAELHEIMADPFSIKLAKTVTGWIEGKTPMGRLIIDLLEKAENGNFADGLTPSLAATPLGVLASNRNKLDKDAPEAEQ